MPLELYKQKWTQKIYTLTIGATPAEGGTRESVVQVGGITALPFLTFEGEMPYSPVIAMEVWDMAPPEWPPEAVAPFADVIDSPVKWAKKCVQEYQAQLLCLRLMSIHPDTKNASAEEASQILKAILSEVGVPLIVWGSGNAEKDNEVLPRCTQVAAGENCLFGTATKDNYKTLVASCLADKQSIIAESPLDINIEKQVNILISEMGFPLERIVIFPTTGGLGYGLEYAYSIMERGRLAGLSEDKLLAMPVICTVGPEAWRAKEAKVEESEFPQWGKASERGPMWEAITAVALLIAGAEILVMRHPKSINLVKHIIGQLMGKEAGKE